MITKKHDWKKGQYAFFVKAILPDGAVIEYECPHVHPVVGKQAWEDLKEAMGFKPDEPEVAKMVADWKNDD
jgi:hypothetical protein